MAKILLRNALFGEKWTPKKLQNSLKFWYDASDTSTITPNVGNVTQMLDKSGNGWTIAPPPVGAVGPMTGTRTLNGLNVLDYNQLIIHALENTSFSQSQPLCIACVFRFDDEGISGDLDFVFSGTEFIPPTLEPRLAIRRSALSSWQILTHNGTVGSPQGVAIEGFEYIGCFYFGKTAGKTTMRINGSFINNGTVANNDFDSINIGSNENAGTRMDGFIAEILAFTNSEDQEKVEGYLAHKWGMVNKLPSIHPYKTKNVFTNPSSAFLNYPVL
jgi:hypothetical protein